MFFSKSQKIENLIFSKSRIFFSTSQISKIIFKNLKFFKNQNPKIKFKNLKSENKFQIFCRLNFLFNHLFFFRKYIFGFFFGFPSENLFLPKFQGKCDLRFPSPRNPSFVVSVGLTMYSLY